MKASKSRIANSQAKAQKRKAGPPPVSKYAQKNGHGWAERAIKEAQNNG